MQTYITIEELYDMAKEYYKFSCKPKFCKYKDSTVFDEDKSVKWNREEVERLNKLHDDEVKSLNTQKNKLLVNFIRNVKTYIVQETNVTEVQANKIYEYLCNEYHDYGFEECLNHLDDLLDLFI